jgi:hypothetical protein
MNGDTSRAYRSNKLADELSNERAEGLAREPALLPPAQPAKGRISDQALFPAGIVLIILGGFSFLIILAGVDVDLSRLWPLLIVVPGAMLLVTAFTGGASETRRSAVTGGTLLVLLGSFFLATTLGILSWSDQSTLWPLYLLIPGVSLLAGKAAAGEQLD